MDIKTKNNKQKITAGVISSYAYIRGHNNYGSLLQYYALQQYLKKFGVDAYWIRYMFPKWTMYKGLCKKILVYLYHGLHVKNVWNHIKTQIAFRHFMHTKCNVSDKKYDDLNELNLNPPKADIYITGADQVWGGWLEPNYLTFAPKEKKKIAYAVSFGRQQLTAEHQNHIQDWVKQFDAISVRESSGIEICRKMGKDAVHLLDPTLLLDDVDYLPVNAVRAEKRKYIFCYFINEKDAQSLRIKDIISYSENKKIKLKITGIEGPEYVIPSKYLYQYSPEIWLNHYKYAECIFTNTFHGTVFSIIFRKQFYVLLQEGATEKQNERIFSLLKLFGLQNRILSHSESISDKIMKPINWDYVETVKKQMRGKTDIFFKEILND